MFQFLKRLFLFLLLFSGIYTGFTFFALPVLLKSAFGLTVQEQIDKSFSNAKNRNYDLLILGSSRLYCGVNPDFFSVKAYNFAHNNDTYNQMYYKLKWVLAQGKKPKYLIVSTDYHQFGFTSDTRNYVYKNYLGSEYMKDYDQSFYEKVKDVISELRPYKFRRLLRFPYNKHDLKDNGQFVRLGEEGEDFSKSTFKFIDLQAKYFDLLLGLAKEHDMKVYIVLPPMREVELNQYTPEQINLVNKFIEARLDANVVFLDYSVNHGFKMNDFIDMAHLNQKAAITFTNILNNSILHK